MTVSVLEETCFLFSILSFCDHVSPGSSPAGLLSVSLTYSPCYWPVPSLLEILCISLAFVVEMIPLPGMTRTEEEQVEGGIEPFHWDMVSLTSPGHPRGHPRLECLVRWEMTVI